MKLNIIKYRRWLLNMPYFKRIGVSYLIMVGIAVVELLALMLTGLIVNVDENSISLYDSMPDELLKLIPLLLLFAFIESLFFQYLPFKIFKFFCDIRDKMLRIMPYVIVSGIVFGALHWTSDLVYPSLNMCRVIFHSICGMHIAFMFYVFRKRRQCGLLSITLVHWFYNVVLFV